jgi:phospholipase/lecithinase/hemolysin
MKALRRLIMGIWGLGHFVLSAQGAITSLYAFSDGVSTTTNNTNPSVAYLYYGHRFCNGRVWVEVLSQRQGIPYEASKNWSYFGHYSSDLLANLNRFPAPADASTALFMVWVSDADFVYDLNNIDPPYTTNSSLSAWNNAINQSLANHRQAIQSLYAKGARRLIMPNGVDVSKTPYFAYLASSDKTFVRQRVIDFNAGFAALLDQMRASLPGVIIYAPDFFALVDKIVAHPADYGLIKPGTDAIDDSTLSDKSLNGPGASYVFWDYLQPTAKVQMFLADTAQQLVSPVAISNLTPFSGSNQLDIANVPIGRNGLVQGSADLVNWATGPAIASTNLSQTVFAPAFGPIEYYRLSFPFVWTWP